jgi:hypothetical protein
MIAGMNRFSLPVADIDCEKLLTAADLVTLARTAVADDYRGAGKGADAPEMPTRFAKHLAHRLGIVPAAKLTLGKHTLNCNNCGARYWD